MSEFILWSVMAAAGFALMLGRGKTTKPWVDPNLERAAALFFIAAGTLAAPGWPSSVTMWLANVLNQLGAAIDPAASQLGTVALIIAAFIGSVYWFLGLLPNSLFSEPLPDWLTVGGLVLPAMASGIPGPIGEAIRAFHGAISDTMVSLTLGALG